VTALAVTIGMASKVCDLGVDKKKTFELEVLSGLL